MGETLTQQRRVSDEGFRVVKLCQVGRTRAVQIVRCVDGTTEIRGVQALFGIIGRKERVGGLLCQM